MTNRPTPASPSPAQTPRGRGLRYTLIGFAGLLALLMAGAAIGVATFDPNSLKPRIQEAVRQATGRDLALNGEIGVKLSLWPTIAVRDVGFANPPGFSRPHLLTLQGLELRLALLPLLTRRVAIERLALVGADIRLETRADGNRNWVLSLPPQPDRQAVATEATEPRRDPGLFASLGTLRIESGKLAWHDERTGQHHDLVIEALDVTSESDLAPLRINGGVTFDSVPVAITGETDSLARLLGSEPASPIRVAMTVKAAGAMASVEGSVTDPRGRRGYDGTLHVTLPDTAALAPLMPGVAIPAARDIALSARVRGQGTELPEIDGISLKTGVFVLPDPVKDTQIDRIEASAPSVAQPIALSIAGRRADRVDDLYFVISLRLDRFGSVEKSFGFDRRLRYDQRISETRKAGDFRFVPNHERMIRGVPFHADHLRMIRTSDDDDVSILLSRARRELLHTGYERTCCIDNL